MEWCSFPFHRYPVLSQDHLLNPVSISKLQCTNSTMKTVGNTVSSLKLMTIFLYHWCFLKRNSKYNKLVQDNVLYISKFPDHITFEFFYPTKTKETLYMYMNRSLLSYSGFEPFCWGASFFFFYTIKKIPLNWFDTYIYNIYQFST